MKKVLCETIELRLFFYQLLGSGESFKTIVINSSKNEFYNFYISGGVSFRNSFRILEKKVKGEFVMKIFLKVIIILGSILTVISCSNNSKTIIKKEVVTIEDKEEKNKKHVVIDCYIPDDVIADIEKRRLKYMLEDKKGIEDIYYSYYYNEKGEGVVQFIMIPKTNYYFKDNSMDILFYRGGTYSVTNKSISREELDISDIKNRKGINFISKKYEKHINNYIPKERVKQIEKFRDKILSENKKSVSDIYYSYFYNEKGEGCVQFTQILKKGYTSDSTSWIAYTFRKLSSKNGDSKKSLLSQKKYDLSYFKMQKNLKNDSVFKEIAVIVDKIAYEYDYDFSIYGLSPKYYDETVKKGVCESYAKATVEEFKEHPLIEDVEYWSGGNHAWNVLVLKDGRRLYCDITWYDGNKIDESGYVVHTPSKTPYCLTFDINDFNSNGGAIDVKTGELVEVHFKEKDLRLVSSFKN